MIAKESGIGVALLDAVEVERQAVWDRFTASVGELEASRDSDLVRLGRVMAAFGNDETATPTDAKDSVLAPTPQRSRRRRQARSAVSPAAALARREAVLRYLTEQDTPVALGDIYRALDVSPSGAKNALKRLSEEGRVARTGTGTGTRYYAKDDTSVDPGSTRTTSHNGHGTVQGRLLTIIRDRASASPNELAQAVHEPLDVVQRECGILIREEEIRMGRRDGRPVYVSQAVA